jgi:hypothetical protein
MRIIHVNVIERGRGVWLTAAMAIAATLAQPSNLVTVQAEDAAGVKAKDTPPAEDPAEVQRRQQIKQQATHWEQLLTKLLYGELELIRSMSGDIPRDARRAIAQAGEQAVKAAAVRLAELQFGGPRRRPEAGLGRIVINGLGKLIVNGQKIAVEQPAAGGRENKSGDPASLVSDSLAKSLAEHVGTAQAAVFTRQTAERSARRKAAAAHEIVSVLDGELFLTARQREQIERSLLEKWDDSMALSLEGMHWVDDRRVFPGLPTDCISPHLSEAQRKRFAPQGNGGGGVVSQRQTWMRMNVLNNVPAAARDPWWFE